MTTITKNGTELFYKLAQAVDDSLDRQGHGYQWVPWEQWNDVKKTLSLIQRHAHTLARLAVEDCNGPGDWVSQIPYPRASEIYAEHEARVERDTERTVKRLNELAAELPHVEGKPWTVRTGGDPRGYVVALLAPTEELRRVLANTWGGPDHGYGVA